MHRLQQGPQVFSLHVLELPSGMLLMYYIQVHLPSTDSLSLFHPLYLQA